MPRNFPRFLFSNPKNTKSEGPFIVHLLFPKKLYRIEWQFVGGDYTLHEIEGWGDECNEAQTSKIFKETIDWINSQMKAKNIRWQE